MDLRTANSSFIFDRLRRSITLCAVFLAIFFPAALVALGIFLLVVPFVLAVALPAAFLFDPLEPEEVGLRSVASFCVDLGFI